MIYTDKKFLTKKESVEYLTNERGLPTSIYTLNWHIVHGTAPICYQYGGRRKLYSIDDLNAWADSRLVRQM